MSAIDRRVDRLREPEDFRKLFAVAAATALTLLTVVVVSRRMSGAFHGPISPGVPCSVATLASSLSLAALALWRQATRIAFAKVWIPATAIALAVLPPVALGAALWIDPSAFVGGYLAALAAASVICAAAIEDSAAGFVLTNQLRSTLFERAAIGSNSPRASSAIVSQPEEKPAESSTQAVADSEPDESVDVSRSDDSVVQWMTRRRLADGGEVIEGAVKIELQPDENVGVAHLSFVPPLAGDPHAECHLLSEFAGRIRIAAAKAYGLRIEVRQSGEATDSTAINVAFSAQVPPAATRAVAA
jgi:hypothetical protein